MKKLYNSRKGANKRVHPSPSPLPSSSSSSSLPLLSALPNALLALASVLSAEEQEVLVYLLGCEKSKEKQQQRKKKPNNNNKAHPPQLGCSCFGCYKSFWARWDASPNRHVIHVIIDAFEETLESRAAAAAGKIKKRQRKRSSSSKKRGDDEAVIEESMEVCPEKADDGHDGDDGGHDGYDDGHGDDESEDGDEEEEEQSSVKRFVSWVFGINN